MCLKILQNNRWDRDVSQASVQSKTKSFHHHNSKNCDREHARYARHGIVDSRSRTDPVFID